MVAFLTCVYFDQYLNDGKGTVPISKQIIFVVLMKVAYSCFFWLPKKGSHDLRVLAVCEVTQDLHAWLNTINGCLFAVCFSTVHLQTHYLL